MHANTAIAPVALLIVVLIDQAFKSIVQTCLPKRRVSCAPWLEIRRVLHRKQIYGSSSGRALLVALWLAGLLYAFFLLPRTGWLRGDYSMLGIAIALGGAAGNLADILRLGSVVDFIDLGWWPVFNVADAAIVSGLLLAFWS